jgi:hypothetical protein
MSFLGAQNSIALGVQGLIHIDTGGGAGGSADYLLNKSLRFRSSASAYLSRTLTTPTSGTTWTWSAWVKLGLIGSSQYSLFCGDPSGTNYTILDIGAASANTLDFVNKQSTINARLTTTQVFRDPAAWYHIVAVWNTTSATATLAGTPTDRLQLWVNGVQISSFSGSTVPTQNTASIANSAVAHELGAYVGAGGGYGGGFDGEMAEVNFVDGLALAPTLFGATGANSQWLPKAYAGTYGTNGFYLPFTNTTSTSTLVADSSGNANNWTPNNISLTAGSTYDSLTDVPTLTSTMVANYAVLNATVPVGGTFSSANLQYTGPTAWRIVPATMAMSGSYYAEATLLANAGAHALGNTYAAFGVATISIDVINAPGIANTLTVYDTGYVYNQTVQATDIGSSFVLGNVIGIAFNSSTGAFTIYKNNVSVSTGTFSATGPFTFIYASYDGSGGQMAMNFGQRPFTYTPPTGFLALNTFNIPAGTVTTSGTFTGNLSTDGPMVYLNGTPTALTINGNAVTFGTQADKLANGFKVRSSSILYNLIGSNTYVATTVGEVFKYEDAQANP